MGADFACFNRGNGAIRVAGLPLRSRSWGRVFEIALAKEMRHFPIAGMINAGGRSGCCATVGRGELLDVPH